MPRASETARRSTAAAATGELLGLLLLLLLLVVLPLETKQTVQFLIGTRFDDRITTEDCGPTPPRIVGRRTPGPRCARCLSTRKAPRE
jgi:hypothetical protein